ncbi:MAG TPA: hypothetical protein VEX86_19260 [Longimicrobium sp.]|nr:hypothetical protein [Longimicrobium sp.]
MNPANRRLAALALVLGAGLSPLAAHPAAAQRGTTMRVNAADSLTSIVPRQRASSAEAALRTRDGQVAVLLLDSELVVQFTDEGLDRVTRDVGRAESAQGAAARILARMLGAGMAGLLDHGIACRLSELRGTSAQGSRLLVEDRRGRSVFSEMEVNGKQVMDDFPPAEARRFSEAVNRAIRRHRATVSGTRR